FWKTVKQVPNAKDNIRFTIDKETFTYTVDVFRDTLKLPVETLDNLFIEPVDLKFIKRILKIVGYEGIVDKRLKEKYHSIKDDIPLVSVYTTRNVTFRGMLILGEFLTDDIHATEEYKEYKKRLKEKYHSIKDDIPLVSVYTTRNVTFRGMLILGEFLTDDIHATEEYKEYKKVFVRVDVPMMHLQPVESTQRTIRTPSAYRIPTYTTIADDINPRSHKEYPKMIDDDENEKEKEKKDDDNDDDVNDDHTD
nr:hypothetical protein [Tanacetum cinerariifolium]